VISQKARGYHQGVGADKDGAAASDSAESGDTATMSLIGAREKLLTADGDSSAPESVTEISLRTLNDDPKGVCQTYVSFQHSEMYEFGMDGPSMINVNKLTKNEALLVIEQLNRKFGMHSDVDFESILRKPILSTIHSRLPWLLGLLLFQSVSAIIMNFFDKQLSANLVVAFFYSNACWNWGKRRKSTWRDSHSCSWLRGTIKEDITERHSSRNDHFFSSSLLPLFCRLCKGDRPISQQQSHCIHNFGVAVLRGFIFCLSRCLYVATVISL